MNHRAIGRREFLAGAALTAVQAAETRPNIVVVLMDDLRWDELHCTGHPFTQSPNIDKLAAEGATFRNTFVTSPLCSPSRACFLTGLYAHRHGITDNTDRSPASHKLETFPQVLQTAGYETAFVGKWHMGVDDSPRQGFDHWVGFPGQGTYFDPVLNVDGNHVKEQGYTTDILTRHAVELLGRKRSKPLCLYLPHKAVHPELTQFADGSVNDPNGGTFAPAERHKALFANVPVPRSPNAGRAPTGKPALERKIGDLPPLGAQTGTDDETIRNRARMLKAVDEGVGQMRAALQRAGQLDNTVFVFTSDEGYFFGEHGLSMERRLAYEESIRIPLIIRYPRRVKAGRRIDEMALGIDLAPTLLELAGTKSSKELSGRSLVPLLEARKAEWRSSFLIEYFSDRTMARMVNMGYKAVRTAQWKYIHYTELQGMDELYDLRSDPYEMKNRISDSNVHGTLEELKAELRRLAGWNKAALDEVASYVQSQKTTGLLIMQDRKIVYEHNWPLPAAAKAFAAAFTHGTDSHGAMAEDVASAQKSFVALLAGIAIDKGLLDIAKPVSAYLGVGWSKATPEQERAIAVRHLMEMSSGLKEALTYEAPAGTKFFYNTPAYALMKPVLEKASGQKIDDITRHWLTTPLGMSDTLWRQRPGAFAGSGNPTGLYTTPRDMAKLGQLVLDQGKPVISEKQLSALFARSETNPAYGRLWWLNGSKYVLRAGGKRAGAGRRAAPLP